MRFTDLTRRVSPDATLPALKGRAKFTRRYAATNEERLSFQSADLCGKAH